MNKMAGVSGRQAVLAAAVIPAMACHDVDRFEIALANLPAQLEWAALAMEDPSATGSGFVRRIEGRFDLPVFDTEPRGQVWLIAYSEATFASMNPPPEMALRRAHVGVASSDEPVLSRRPDWIARGEWRDGVLAMEETAIVPAVTVDWLPRCPSLVDRATYFATTCITRSCGWTVSQAGCQLAFTGAGCSIPLAGAVGARGQLQLDASDELGDCQPSPVPLSVNATASASCGAGVGGLRCENHLIPAQPPRLRARYQQLFTVPAIEVLNASKEPGFVSGLALVGDTAGERALAVAGYKGLLGDRSCLNTPSELILVDPDTLETRSTVPGFTCLANLASDPRGAGLIATGGAWGQKLLRLDPQGAVLSERDLSSDLPAGSFARTLKVSLAAERVAILYQKGNDTFDGQVLLFDLDLQPVGRLEGLSNRLIAALVTDSGKILLADDRGGIARYSADLREEVRTSLREACGYTTDVLFADADLATGGTVFLSARNHDQGQAVFIVTLAENSCRLSTFFEWPAYPGGTFRWPSDPSLRLVGVDTVNREPDQLRSSVALLDARSGVFVPGSVPVAKQHIVPLDSDGRSVFAILPFDAGVARIDPLP